MPCDRGTLVHGRRVSPTLCVLLALFAGRVAGQVLVVFQGVTWLPPLEQWQSGILPYPLLLASQIAILALLTKVCADVSREKGFFATSQSWFRRGALWFGRVYFAAMIVRYTLNMHFHPKARWIGGTIPMVFHCVLATFIMVFACWHQARFEACSAQKS